jgi:hypothetical protein
VTFAHLDCRATPRPAISQLNRCGGARKSRVHDAAGWAGKPRGLRQQPPSAFSTTGENHSITAMDSRTTSKADNMAVNMGCAVQNPAIRKSDAIATSTRTTATTASVRRPGFN